MLAIAAPGQGSQTPGFLTGWLEVPGVAEILAEATERTGIDVLAAGTVADAESIRDTAVAQPLLVAAALAICPALDASPDIVLGHSVGEFAAAVWAGILSRADALTLVGIRGQAMADAAAVSPTGMAAVVGGEVDQIVPLIESAGLIAANLNGKGQVVAAGSLADLDGLSALLPPRVRALRLDVAGAFHTPHMAPAVDALARAAAGVIAHDPQIPMVANADGSILDGEGAGRRALDLLVAQVARPVRFDRCLETLRAQGVTGVLELAPAGTLTGLVRRNLAGVEFFALNQPDRLEQARAFCADHRTRAAGRSLDADTPAKEER